MIWLSQTKTSAAIVADSVNEFGDRLITWVLTYYRGIHAEVMTHRMFSRNSGSSRAMPTLGRIIDILNDPYIPEVFGVNQRGMQSERFLERDKHNQAVQVWLAGRDRAATSALELLLGQRVAQRILGYEPGGYAQKETILSRLNEIGQCLSECGDKYADYGVLNIHKQWTNRGLESYSYHTIVLTATDYDNFFALRLDGAAQNEIRILASEMRRAMQSSTPKLLQHGQWHTPFVDEKESDDVMTRIKLSVGRAAAVSYGRQDVKDAPADIARYHRMLKAGHMSPFEHQATPISRREHEFREELIRLNQETWLPKGDHTSELFDYTEPDSSVCMLPNERLAIAEDVKRSLEHSGNFAGWRASRKFIPNEDNFAKITSST